MEIKRKAYVCPNLTCYAMELQQMIAETGFVKQDFGKGEGGLEDPDDSGAPEVTPNNIELKWFSDGLE